MVLGISWTNVDSQWNPVYNASHRIFVVETKRFVGSFVNVISTWQTCGQRSSRAAERKRWALGNYFSERICYMFLISKCREDWDLGVRTISVLAFENRSAMAKSDFAASKHVVFRKSPPWLRIGAPNAYTEVLCTDLHLSLFYILTTGTYGKFARENTFFHFSCLWLESNLSNSCTQFPIVTVIQLLTESGVALPTDASVVVKWRLLLLLLRKKS